MLRYKKKGQELMPHIQSDAFVLRDSLCVKIWEPAFCMGIRDFISQCCLRNTIRIKGMADYFGGRGVFQRAGADVPYSETLSCYVTPCVLIYKKMNDTKKISRIAPNSYSGRGRQWKLLVGLCMRRGGGATSSL